MRSYLGIDPGLKGGICLLTPFDAQVWRMPETPAGIVAIIRSVSDHRPTVILEKAQAMPPTLRGRRQGTGSAFAYGMGYGVLKGIIAALSLPFQEIRPAEWKKVILHGEPDKSDKGTSIRVCERLFPQVELVPKGCKKPQDGLAEAALLAEYGRRMNL